MAVAYFLDTSVVLRWVLREPEALAPPGTGQGFYASRLLQTESLRVLERLLKLQQITETDYPVLRKDLFEVFSNLNLVSLSEGILERAESSFPTSVGTLDALHISTCLALIQNEIVEDIVFLTHDTQQATAASSVGLKTEIKA